MIKLDEHMRISLYLSLKANFLCIFSGGVIDRLRMFF